MRRSLTNRTEWFAYKSCGFLATSLRLPCLLFAGSAVLSRVLLFVTPWTVAHQTPLSIRILQALGAGALGRPRGMVWGGMREEGSGWGTHVYTGAVVPRSPWST